MKALLNKKLTNTIIVFAFSSTFKWLTINEVEYFDKLTRDSIYALNKSLQGGRKEELIYISLTVCRIVLEPQNLKGAHINTSEPC